MVKFSKILFSDKSVVNSGNSGYQSSKSTVVGVDNFSSFQSSSELVEKVCQPNQKKLVSVAVFFFYVIISQWSM